MVCEGTARRWFVKSQQGNGLFQYNQEMVCVSIARRWFVKLQQGDGL